MAKEKNIEGVENKPIESTLNPRKANENDVPKLKLTTLRGEVKVLTVEQHLLPHNLKQYSKNIQEMLKNGKSAYQLLSESGQI